MIAIVLWIVGSLIAVFGGMWLLALLNLDGNLVLLYGIVAILTSACWPIVRIMRS